MNTFIVTDKNGDKYEVTSTSYASAAKTVAKEILDDEQQMTFEVKGKKFTKQLDIKKKSEKLYIQKGAGWSQTIKTQAGSGALRSNNKKATKTDATNTKKSSSVRYSGNTKNLKGKKHKEAFHHKLGNGFVPEDFQLPENPLQPIKINEVPHQYYLIPDKQTGGFLPFLAALIPAGIAAAKAAALGGATALGGYAVNKMVTDK